LRENGWLILMSNIASYRPAFEF